MSRIAFAAPVAVAVPERRVLTRKQRERVHAAHNGLCGLCGLPVDVREAEYDHRLARGLGADQGLDNYQPTHPACHAIKTKRDRKAIAKADRILARITGTRRARKAIASRGFSRTLKRKFNGRVEIRAADASSHKNREG